MVFEVLNEMVLEFDTTTSGKGFNAVDVVQRSLDRSALSRNLGKMHCGRCLLNCKYYHQTSSFSVTSLNVEHLLYFYKDDTSIQKAQALTFEPFP